MLSYFQHVLRRWRRRYAWRWHLSRFTGHFNGPRRNDLWSDIKYVSSSWHYL